MSICAALVDEELDRLNAIVSTREVQPHGTVFSEGDLSDEVFNVTAGVVTVYKLMADGRRQITGFMFPGDFIGLSVEGHFAYSAEAATAVSLCRFPRRKLDALLDEYPRLQRQMTAVATSELVAAQDQMLLLGRKTAKEKIASFLLGLSRRAEHRGHLANPVYVPVSRADIGDYLGLTTETVSRTFTQLKSSGTIRLLDGHRVDLKGREELQSIAEGG